MNDKIRPHDYEIDILHGWHVEKICKECNSLFRGIEIRAVCKVCRDKAQSKLTDFDRAVYDSGYALTAREIHIAEHFFEKGVRGWTGGIAAKLSHREECIAREFHIKGKALKE